MVPRKAIQGWQARGGVILDPDGKTEHSFAWGLGIRTNNEAEWLALLQGLRFLQAKKLRKALIFGDSKHVISKIVNGYPSGAVRCRRLYNKVKSLWHHTYQPLHILRTNNKAADAMANIGATLAQGVYKQDGDPPSHIYIP